MSVEVFKLIINKKKQAERASVWVKANPERYKEIKRNYRLKKAFGITAKEYDVMFNKQKGLCAICSKPQLNKALAVDHDHNTDTVRELLCSECNQGLGKFKENIELLKLSINYLERHKCL